MKTKTKLQLVCISILTAIVLAWIGCSSSQVKPNTQIPNLSTKSADVTPKEETAPASTKTEERAPAAESKPEPEKPTGPVCISRWNDLSLLAPLPGMNIKDIVERKQATFSATDGGKQYKLVDAGGGLALATPDMGQHNITKICKQPNGKLVATASVFGGQMDIDIQHQSGKTYNIKSPVFSTSATVE